MLWSLSYAPWLLYCFPSSFTSASICHLDGWQSVRISGWSTEDIGSMGAVETFCIHGEHCCCCCIDCQNEAFEPKSIRDDSIRFRSCASEPLICSPLLKEPPPSQEFAYCISRVAGRSRVCKIGTELQARCDDNMGLLLGNRQGNAPRSSTRGTFS